jgi:hypothetical protein
VNAHAGLAIGMLLGGGVRALSAQSRFGITPMAQGILVADHSGEIPGGGSLTEVNVVQPVLMAVGHGFGDKLSFTATLDLEGITMKSGELTPGAWGEGFVDRRHPHTYAHELNFTINDLLGRLDGRGRLSITLGKGFVPFGSDDPMSRPFVRYPVNHHLSQLLERAIGIVQYDIGPVTVEGSLFDGDEPTKPTDWPLLRYEGKWRFGDSYGGRMTIRPFAGLEVQGSLAHVHSPESRQGAGPDAEKQSASARWDRVTAAGEQYVLAEYARSSELGGFFVYHTYLAEGLISRGRARLSYRFESTERPEELRLVDEFRTLRPSPDNSILGITRWNLHTVHLAYDVISPHRHFTVQPFVEATFGHVSKAGAGVFDPVAFYGTDQVRALNVGLMMRWGMRGHRMGRYGALASDMGGMNGMTM